MKKVNSLSIYTVLIFSSVLFSVPAGYSSEIGGEAGGLMPMKGGLSGHSVSADSLPENNPAALDEDRGLNDHKAQIFETEGEVSVLKKDSEIWQKAVKGMVLEEGDKIVTGAASHVDIAYDHFFLNIVRIKEKTKGEFRSIEPTQLFLEDGTIFSALDGLAGQTYQISTPTAVAGVRGTTFDVGYDAQTGNLETHVFPDQSSHIGKIALTGEDGKEFQIVEGQGFSDGVVGEIPQEKMEDAKQFLQAVDAQFSDSRSQGFQILNDSGEIKSEKKEPVEDRLGEREETKKIGGGPNDGGDTGGSGLNRQDRSEGMLTDGPRMDGDVDALVDDAMTPPSSNFSGAETGGNPASGRLDAPENGDRQEPENFKNSGTDSKHQPDYHKAVEFLGVGGYDPDQKGKEVSVTEFFDPKGTMQFSGMSSAHSEMPHGITSGKDAGDQSRSDFEKEPGSGSHGGYQPPVFDPSQFFQPGNSSGNFIQPDPNFRPEIKDQIINSNNSGSGGDCTSGNCSSSIKNEPSPSPSPSGSGI